MIRVVIGVANILFQCFWVIAMLASGEASFIEYMISIAIIVAFSALIFSGIKMMKLREKVILLALKTIKNSDDVDYNVIKSELNVNEYQARKYILWGHKKKLFFRVTKGGEIKKYDVIVEE